MPTSRRRRRRALECRLQPGLGLSCPRAGGHRPRRRPQRCSVGPVESQRDLVRAGRDSFTSVSRCWAATAPTSTSNRSTDSVRGSLEYLFDTSWGDHALKLGAVDGTAPCSRTTGRPATRLRPTSRSIREGAAVRSFCARSSGPAVATSGRTGRFRRLQRRGSGFQRGPLGRAQTPDAALGVGRQRQRHSSTRTRSSTT